MSSQKRLWQVAGEAWPQRTAVVLAIAVAAIATIDLLGWAFHIPTLVTVSPRFATMKPNTALCMLLIAYSIAIDVAESGRHVSARWTAECLNGLSLLVAGASWLEYLLRVDLHIDGILIAVPADKFGDPAGRMALGTAMTIVFTSLALLLRDRSSFASRCLVFAGLALSTSGLMGFLLGAGPLTGVPWLKSMAVRTAMTLLMLQITILCTRPEREPFRSLTSYHTTYVHRGHLLASVTVVPILLGMPVMIGLRHAWYDAAFALSLLLVLLVGVQTYLLWSANVAIDKAAAALMQSEKLAAVGRLASSISHEINNPLESVTNLLYLARHVKSPDEIQNHIRLAEQELMRVSAITNQTLRFHKQSTKPRPVAPGELFTSVLTIFQGKLLNSNVTVEQRLRANDPVLCFDGEIRQVLSNLMGNAIDAMSATGGRLLVRSRHVTSPANGVLFVVADNGPGIAASTLEKIFEPFFTTKGKNGTGLGLWISKEIVARHNGRLHVRSTQRRDRSGTVFTMFLPSAAIERNSHTDE